MQMLPRLFKRAKFRRLFVLLLTLALFFGSLIVPIERRDPNANLTNYFDSTWWTITTITTVGYGDFVPVTHSGKILGAILQVFGVLLYGSLIALIAMGLNRNQEEFHQKRMMERLDRLEGKIDDLSKGNEFLIKDQTETTQMRERHLERRSRFNN